MYVCTCSDGVIALGVGDLTDTAFDESMAAALAFALLLLRNEAAEILLGRAVALLALLLLLLLLVGLPLAFGV